MQYVFICGEIIHNEEHGRREIALPCRLMMLVIHRELRGLVLRIPGVHEQVLLLTPIGAVNDHMVPR